MKITESNEDKIMYELIKKDGLAKKRKIAYSAWCYRDTCIYECGNGGCDQGRSFHR